MRLQPLNLRMTKKKNGSWDRRAIFILKKWQCSKKRKNKNKELLSHNKAKRFADGSRDLLKLPSIAHNWILNTPERKGILRHGPPKHVNCNILGKGAYGTVFKAIFRNRPVAVKIVKNRTGVNRTENETNILGWKHRHIVKILKVESTNNFGIIIMEHYPGQSLQTILDSMELPLQHRILIAMDVSCALSFCHRHELLHLDVKPQNILVAFVISGCQASNWERTFEISPRRNYVCKLCDFGSSVRLNVQKSIQINAGGTVRYMSPEVLRAESLSPGADIYSLGVTMWQLKKRRPPYDVIQCNEVVAFQVVKHNLRPNSDLSRFAPINLVIPSPNQKKTNCTCEYYNSQRKFNFVRSQKEPHLDAFDMRKLSPRGCYSAGKNENRLNVSVSPIPSHRKALRILNFNSPRKAVRDLRKELGFIDCVKDNTDQSINVHKLFQDGTSWTNDLRKKKEIEYSTIYQACWRCSPEKRPSASDLYKQFKTLLM